MDKPNEPKPNDIMKKQIEINIEENKKSIDKSIIINARKIKSLTEKTIVREI